MACEDDVARSVKAALRRRLAVNPSRSRLEDFAARAAATAPAGAHALDAGSGEGMYRRYFSHATYESSDFLQQVDRQSTQVDYKCDLRSIPVPDERYDLVLLTQVLEHLPKDVLRELRRVEARRPAVAEHAAVLRGARASPTTSTATRSSVCATCSPRQSWRSRSWYGWRDYCGTLYQQALVAFRSLPVVPGDYGRGFVGWLAALTARGARPALVASAVTFARLELRHSYTGAGHPKNYCIMAART